MVQSVELLLDPSAEEHIRAQWAALIAAGLPSQGRLPGPTNRPHVTLGVALSVTADQESAVVEAVRDLPTTVRLGAPILFGDGPFVLARLVVADVDLLSLQQRVVSALDSTHSFRHQLPGAWTGHVTLARRIHSAQLAAALACLVPNTDVVSRVVGVRRWDGDRKVAWLITDPASDVQLGQHDR